MKYHFILVACIFSFLFQPVNGQDTLYAIKDSSSKMQFVSIDCSNNQVNVLKTLNINFYSFLFSSCYDYINKKYYLVTQYFILNIDALTGAVLDSNPYNLPSAEHFYHMSFNQKDGYVYGIVRNLANLEQYFSRYDPSSGLIDTLYPILPPIHLGRGCESFIDQDKQEYILASDYLTAFDISSGQILYNIPIQNMNSETFDHIAYSCKTNSIYGQSNNPRFVEEYFSSIDTLNGNVSHIGNALPVYFHKHYSGGSTIDNNSDTYYYSAAGGKIYGIDIHSGNVTYSHDFGPYIEFLFLKSGASYGCIIDKENDEILTSELSIVPNPSMGVFSIDNLSNDLKEGVLIVNDSQGREIINDQHFHQNLIDLNSYDAGTYFYTLQTGTHVYRGKLLNL